MLNFLLITEYYDYNQYMTDILFVDAPNFQSTPQNISIHRQIITIMQDNQFFCTEVAPDALQTLIPFALLKP